MLVCPVFSTTAQNCSSANLQLQSEIASTCSFMTIATQKDVLNRPFLYVANKESGLTIYDVSDLANPSYINGVSISLFASLEVMNVSQEGNFLYLALGNHFTNPQQSGMAIIDVSSPFFPFMTDFYVVPASSSGAGIVKTSGNYAFLGAMQSGLVILDITDKHNIQFVSQFVPDINYPAVNPDPAKYNARGMEVKDDIVYLCYDAGGLRIINCSDKFNPTETGRYANPALYLPFNLPRAYNNIVVNDSLAYVAVDYCGMEILNISDTANISLQGWWNPYNCPGNNWFTSPSHANEIQYDPNCQVVFLSTGKSDAMVVDVSDPSNPDSCNYFGGVNNSIGTWGISRYENELYLSYICTFGFPFPSNYTGVKILTYNSCQTAIPENIISDVSQLIVYPNPTCGSITIYLEGESFDAGIFDFSISDVEGRAVNFIVENRSVDQALINLEQVSSGIYFLSVKANGDERKIKIIKTPHLNFQ